MERSQLHIEHRKNGKCYNFASNNCVIFLLFFLVCSVHPFLDFYFTYQHSTRKFHAHMHISRIRGFFPARFSMLNHKFSDGRSGENGMAGERESRPKGEKNKREAERWRETERARKQKNRYYLLLRISPYTFQVKHINNNLCYCSAFCL